MLDDMLPNDGVAVVIASALLARSIFNHYEPIAIVPLALLLVVIPFALCPLIFKVHGALGIAFTFALYYGTLLATIALYRVSPFHSLAQYPGPLLAKVTRWYWAWIASSGRQHLELSHLHEALGDIVRIGPNEVSIRDVKAIQPLMETQGWPKGPMWVGRTLHPQILPLIAQRDSAEHARRRRPWIRALNPAALKEYEPMVQKRVSQFVSILAREKTVDLAAWANLFTFDIMMDTLFGTDSDMMATQDKNEVVHAILKGFTDSQLFENIPWLSYYARHIPRFSSSVRKFRALCVQQGLARYKRGSTVKDLFYYLSNEDGAENETPPKPVVLSDAALAVIAGSDTTAASFCHIVYCLLTHPETYERLQREVDRFYPPGEDSLNPQHHSTMPYLEAVINETMRLYPNTASGSQRAPPAGSGGGFIGPYFIPEGTQARVHTWAVHRDPRNFSHPDTFLPERWLAAAGAQPWAGPGPLVHTPDAFIPFSVGPFNCVGKGMALLELRVVLCHMLQRLSLRFEDRWDPREFEQTREDRFTTRVGRLPVVVTLRA